MISVKPPDDKPQIQVFVVGEPEASKSPTQGLPEVSRVLTGYGFLTRERTASDEVA